CHAKYSAQAITEDRCRYSCRDVTVFRQRWTCCTQGFESSDRAGSHSIQLAVVELGCRIHPELREGGRIRARARSDRKVSHCPQTRSTNVGKCGVLSVRGVVNRG